MTDRIRSDVCCNNKYRKGTQYEAPKEGIETYEDLPNASNKEVISFLREQINVILKKANLNWKIIVACFNEILNEIEKRLK